MANKQVDQLTSSIPTLDDLTVSFDNADTTELKKTTWQWVRDLFGSYFSIDTSVVHNTWNETIAGIKTFTSPLITNWAINFNAPEWFLINWKIVPSVTSNNLTVAIKTLAGTDPSATDPVYVRIGDVVRSITSALSVSWAAAGDAGTNYLNLWSAELATKETDLFVYLWWVSASSAVNMYCSRIPHAWRYDDFVASNTDEKWRIRSLNVTPANWNSVVNIWRFNATLSAGAGYTWSIPATSVIINSPIYETRWITGANYRQKVQGDTVIIEREVAISITSGTEANSTALTLPITYSSTAYNISLGWIDTNWFGTLNETPTINYNSKTTSWFTLSYITRLWNVAATRNSTAHICTSWKW